MTSNGPAQPNLAGSAVPQPIGPGLLHGYDDIGAAWWPTIANASP